MWVGSLGREDPLEKGMATHPSILAWISPWTEEPGGLQFMGLQRVGHNRGRMHLLVKILLVDTMAGIRMSYRGTVLYILQIRKNRLEEVLMYPR